jgi:hypothetical protein
MSNRSNRFFRALARMGAAAVFAAGVAGAAPLKLEQFVAGWPLDVAADQKVFDVALTSEVYRYAATSNELAVLDAFGNTMPFYRVSPAPVAATEQRVPLMPSPLYSMETPDGVAQLSVATADRQTNVTVTQGAGEREKEIVAFVIDARGVSATPVAFELDWRAQTEPFLLDVRIEQSRTLADWRLVGRASVAELRIGGADVLHKRVPVNASAGGYFRVTWANTLPDWYLERATLVSATVARVAPEMATVEPLAEIRSPLDAHPPPNALYFDAGGTLPVSSVTLDFADDNGWASGSVATASSLDGPWHAVAYSPLFYEIDYQGQRFASEPLEVGRRDARYWRIATAEPLARERVALRLQYPAEQLRVSAAGTAPYLLAAGTLAPQAGPDATFAAVWSELPPGSAPPRAALGPLRELGGVAALQVPYEFPWRVTLLWAVLGGGAFAVAWMAVRLARELKGPQS